MHMLFSEKEKLEKEYLQWCEKANKEIHGGRIDDKSFITVISFLQSIGWGNIKELESENAELRARLDKEVELPCKVGDTVYQYDNAGRIYVSKIKNIVYETNGIAFDKRAINNSIFLTRAEAESRLAELKGEQQ